MPIALENDETTVLMALSRVRDPSRVRMARIKNTLKLENLWITKALLPELEAKPEIIIDQNPIPMEFDPKGKILPIS